jgi:hypothetical protein
MANDTEADIRDMFSTTMKTMAREMDNMNKKALELGTSGASSFDKFKRQNDALNESNKRTSGSLASMSTILTGITRNLVGPVGVVAGFVAFQKALENVSEGAIQLKNFGTNSGFATASIQEMQQAMRRMGMTTQEADTSIATLGNKLNNLRAFKEGSEVFQALAKSVGGVEFANRILEFEKLGDRMGAINEISKTFNSQSRETKILLSQIFDTQISTFEGLQRARERGIEVWPISLAEAQKYHDYWVDFEINFGNIWNSIANHGIKGVHELTEAISAEGVTTVSIAKWLNSEMDAALAGIKTTIDEFKAIKAFAESNSVSDFVNKKLGLDPWDSKAYPVGEDPMTAGSTISPETMAPSRRMPRVIWDKKIEGKRSDLGTHGDITDFSGRRRDDEQVGILRDMRDTLLRMETKEPILSGPDAYGGTTGSTGYPAGQARRGVMGGVRRGAARGGGGGGGGMTGTGAGGVEPGSGGDPNLTGSEFLKSQRARFAKELEENPQTAKELAALTTLEGNPANVTESMMNRMAMTGGTLAGAMHGGKRGRGFYGPINNGQLPGAMAALERDPKRAAKIKAAIDSVLAGRNVLKGATDQGMALDPNGSWQGGMVHGQDQVYNDWGGGGGHEASRRFRENQQRQVNQERIDGAAARAKVDQSETGPFAKGAINASVEFLNVPPGVRTKADVDGDVFKDLQISKTKQSGVYRQPGQAYD